MAGVNALRWGPVVGKPERARSAKRKQVAALRPGARFAPARPRRAKTRLFPMAAPSHHFKSHCHEGESSKKVHWRDPVNTSRWEKQIGSAVEGVGRGRPAPRHPHQLQRVEAPLQPTATPSILNHAATQWREG